MRHEPLEAVLDRGGVVLRELDGVRSLTYPALDELPGVRALTTLRQPEDSALAASLERWDRPIENVAGTVVQWLGRAFEAPGSSVASGRQVHDDHFVVVSPENAPAPGELRRFDETDALMTHEPDVALVVLTADCLPIFIADAEARAVCLVHAGKAGTGKQITLQVAQAFFGELCTDPRNTVALIGPSIGDGCYPQRLWEENTAQLRAAGIEQIIHSGLCTRCNLDAMHSYRAEKGCTGRMLSTIMLV